MPLSRDKIEKSLKKKGFVPDSTKEHHRYYHHQVNGKRSGAYAYAYVSRGTSHKVYGDNLLAQMYKTLKLKDRKQLVRLVECPMTGEEYIELLTEKGIIKED